MHHTEEEGGKKKRNDFIANELYNPSQVLMTDYATLARDFIPFFLFFFAFFALSSERVRCISV